jgi:hypothetical protein
VLKWQLAEASMNWILALLIVGLAALPALAQVHCTTSKVGGFWTTDCEDLTPRPATRLDPRAGVPDEVESERLRVLRLQRRLLERQLEREEFPRCADQEPGHPRICR